MQRTTDEGQPEKGVQPPWGTREPAGGPQASEGVWLPGGSCCSETLEGDQAGGASLLPAPVPLPAGSLGLLVLWSLAPCPPRMQGFCSCFQLPKSSELFLKLLVLRMARAQAKLMPFKGNGIKSLIDCNRFLVLYCFSALI